MEMLHGLSPEQRSKRKILLLEDCQSEIVVLSSSRLCETWDPALKAALAACARRGILVRILLEPTSSSATATAAGLRLPGLDIRLAPRPFSWVMRAIPIISELWIFDRSEAITVNERVFAGARRDRAASLRAEFLLGSQAAEGLAGYFDRRWSLEGRALSFSIRHKDYNFHGGPGADATFFGVLQGARRDIALSVPSGRISRRIETELHAALRDGVRVSLFTNADRDDAPGLRRLRRLSAAGAMVKICGRRLGSELAVIDGTTVYLGALPSSWRGWAKASCPVFVMKDQPNAAGLLEALEAQVSVEIAGSAAPQALAF